MAFSRLPSILFEYELIGIQKADYNTERAFMYYLHRIYEHAGAECSCLGVSTLTYYRRMGIGERGRATPSKMVLVQILQYHFIKWTKSFVLPQFPLFWLGLPIIIFHLFAFEINVWINFVCKILPILISKLADTSIFLLRSLACVVKPLTGFILVFLMCRTLEQRSFEKKSFRMQCRGEWSSDAMRRSRGTMHTLLRCPPPHSKARF